MVGRLDSIDSGDAVQQFFRVFGVHFYGGGQYVNIYPLRILVRFCFGGLCLVCPAIGSLMWMWECQFGFHWPSGIHLHC